MILKSKHKLNFDAIGTTWSIETDLVIEDDLKRRINERIEEFDRTYSRFREDSLVTQLAQQKGEYDFPTDAEKLVEFYRELHEATDGAVSPLVGDALVAVGYDRSYSLQENDTPKVLSWQGTMEWLGTHVTMHQAATLDFGAAGKGYLVDLIGELLAENGHEIYVIDASGDVRVRGVLETIGLENPYDAASVIGTMKVENASLCASATNRRAWGDWHHIIDPRTAKPVSEVVATWVSAATTLEADGIATALFFVGPERLKKWKFTYVRLWADGRIEHSPDFMGELFT